MGKIYAVYEAKVVQDNEGFWHVWRNGALSGNLRTRDHAEQNLLLFYEAAKEQFGDKYEVVLKRVD